MIIFAPAEQKDQSVNGLAIHQSADESETKPGWFILEKGHHLFVKRDHFLDLNALNAKFPQHDIKKSLKNG
jgi:hypothetical protein